MHNPFIFGNDADAVDIATRVAMVSRVTKNYVRTFSHRHGNLSYYREQCNVPHKLKVILYYCCLALAIQFALTSRTETVKIKTDVSIIKELSSFPLVATFTHTHSTVCGYVQAIVESFSV